MKDKTNISIQDLLEMSNGRAKAKELGLEKEFEMEIQKLKKKYPMTMTFHELALVQRDALAQQIPPSLDEIEEQEKFLDEMIARKRANK